MAELVYARDLKSLARNSMLGSNPTRATKQKIRLTQQLYNNTYQNNLLKKL